MCVYIYIYTCVYIHMCICICIYIYIYMMGFKTYTKKDNALSRVEFDKVVLTYRLELIKEQARKTQLINTASFQISIFILRPRPSQFEI